MLNLQTLNNMMTDDGVYEYMFLYLRFVGSGDNNTTTRHISYLIPTDFGTGDISWQNGAMAKLNELSQEGWKVNSRLTSGIGYDSFYIYELMRKVEEQD